MQDLRIVCARPAKTFTAGHDSSWTAFVGSMVELDAAAVMFEIGADPAEVHRYLGDALWNLAGKYLGFPDNPRRNHLWRFTVQSSDIYNSRNATLAATYKTDKYPEDLRDWTPFNGKLDYTHILWIDSDMTFTLEDVLRITSHNVPIVSARAMVSPTQYHCGYFFNEEILGNIIELGGGHYEAPATGKGIWYPTIWEEELWRAYAPAKENGLIPIDFCGLAFLCVEKGVFEAMPYPWFRTTLHDNYGRLIETSEDIGWCSRAREAGFEILLDPEIAVGHEKTVELKPPPWAPAQKTAPDNGNRKGLEVLRA